MFKKSEKIIANPNLPDNKVRKALVGEISMEVRQSLESLDIEIITPTECGDVLTPLRLHPDMLCHIAPKAQVFLAQGQEALEKELTEIGFDICDKVQLQKDYPKDVPLNAAFIGSALICKPSAVSPELLQHYKSLGVRIIETNQGYSKCSVAVVADNAIITEDESIYKACIVGDVDALLIKKGYVHLSGFDCGFIGGAAGLVSKDCLAFTGNIHKHPSYGDIRAFAGNYGVQLLSMSSEPLYDTGGIIPLTELK
jgi:hypothetical protein